MNEDLKFWEKMNNSIFYDCAKFQNFIIFSFFKISLTALFTVLFTVLLTVLHTVLLTVLLTVLIEII